jgi:ketosteroid isomerase-like protein
VTLTGPTPTVSTLEAIADAFSRHDLDAIMDFFTDDATFDFPRGPDPWGQRYEGKAAVREGLAKRFAGIPDVPTATTTTSSPATAAPRNGP